MLLEFTVYFARSLGDAEEKAKKIKGWCVSV